MNLDTIMSDTLMLVSDSRLGGKSVKFEFLKNKKKKKKWAIGIERGMTIGNKHFEELI